MIIMVAGQILAYFMLAANDWFVPARVLAGGSFNPDNSIECQATTTIFLYANFQYIIVVLAFSISKPFRKPIYTNRILLSFVILLSLVCVYFLFGSPGLDFINTIFQTVDLPVNFRLQLFGLVCVNLVTVWLYERLVIVGMLNNFNT